MQRGSLRAATSCALLLALFGAPVRGDETRPIARDAAAFQELLRSATGKREVWSEAPELVVLTSVLQYTATDLSSGYIATSEQLTEEELTRLASDLTRALDVLTAGTLKTFADVRVEAVPPGQTVQVLRRGRIVVGRFRGVRASTSTVGYGGRTAKADGTITAAAIILDRDFDRDDGLRRLLRTHELGHALGYNHVESRKSVMNPRIGTDVTDFDRTAARLAFRESPE